MQNPSTAALILLIGAYLIGSISFAVVVSKLMGLSDPRTYGSKNPGATNVLRTGNKLAAILTLLGDAFKGWFAVVLAYTLAERYQLPPDTVSLAAIAVFLGHLWPIFFRFVGGKGVATAAGVLLGINVWLGLATLLTWIVIAYCFRYSSLAAVVSALFALFYSGLLLGVANPLFGATCVMSALLIYRHKQNVINLLEGKESRIGSKK